MISFDMMMTALSAYMIGAIPFGLVACYLFRLGDIRTIGSGNIGTTNILRTGNKWAALFTLLGDSTKGAIAVLLTLLLYPDEILLSIIAGLSAILGHNFPIWLKFKGGKGVASSIGVMLVWHYPLALFFCGVWLVMALLFRISSLSALTAFIAVVIYSYIMVSETLMIAVISISILAFYQHRQNIIRLWRKEESKISFKKSTS
jgi:glycerol-3-phosphate acyltransferase PlsY